MLYKRYKEKYEEDYHRGTKPEWVKLWQYGSDLITTWEIGSDIKFSTAWEDKVFEQWGKVLAFQPTELVSYSLFAPRPGLEDKPENYFTMSYHLSSENGQTKLELCRKTSGPTLYKKHLRVKKTRH